MSQTLLKELHTSLKPEGWSLTAALGAGKDTMEVAYDLSQLNQYLDHIHLMCYDYHGKWDSQTGANAPLHSADPNDVNTVEYSVKYMLEHGIEPHKLVLGLPMYGRTFIHKDELVSEKLGTPSMSTAFSGPYTKEDGFMGYNEICEELQNNTSWKRLWDESSLTPFAVNGNKVIVYDDEESLKYKVKYAMEKDLGGLMIWSIDIDDFRGDCVAQDGEKKEKFQLLRSVNEAIVSSLREIDVEKEKEKEKSQTEQTTEQTTNEPVTPSKATVLSTSSILISVLLFLPCFFYRTITLMS
ncbi:hypothetical protein J6590_008600 [Homalodisca vitripennis]|nr:hypothetical protein J6590_008600 [Homalodisca vitripennis]